MGDTILMLETIGHQLDQEFKVKYDQYDKEGKENEEISELIEKNMNIGQIIRRSENGWDGGYAICGMIGHGDAFLFRDPHGIRPAFYYIDDEIIVAASERPVIQTVMNVSFDDIKELGAGQALIMKRDGDFYLEQIHEPLKLTQCSFERIYFSRGSDRDIYRERKKLGELLTPSILKAVNYDLKHTVFSFIPNTAEVGFTA
jgi:amidophosphoribosyltransferase